MSLRVPSLTKEQWPDWCCIDCGLNTFPAAPPRGLAQFLLSRDREIPLQFNDQSEVYTVHDGVWKQAGMEPFGGCLCIGCLESRLCRRLKPYDFVTADVFNLVPGTQRLLNRRGVGPSCMA